MQTLKDFRTFLDCEYDKIASILREGSLFSAVKSEEANIARVKDNLSRTSKLQRTQQQDLIQRKYQVKLDCINQFLSKLGMSLNNPSMMTREDITRISGLLKEMIGLVDEQKTRELNDVISQADTKTQTQIDEYTERTSAVLDKHIHDAQAKMYELLRKLEPLNDYYETASIDAPIWDQLKIKSAFPQLDEIRLGESATTVECKNERITCSVPEVVPFFTRNSLTVVYDKNDRTKLKSVVDNILVRGLVSAQTGNVKFTLIDGNGNGSLFFDYLKCSQRTLELFNNNIITRTGDIDRFLLGLLTDYDSLNQTRLKGDTIKVYNKNNPNHTIPYQIVVIDSFPSGLSSSSMQIVSRLIREEINSGLHFVLLTQKENLQSVLSVVHDTALFEISSGYQIHPLMHGVVENTIKYLDHSSKDISLLFEDYFNQAFEWWTGNCANTTSIPLGYGDSGVYNFIFDEEGAADEGRDATAFAIVAGSTGSGKSFFLHNIILSASMMYTPDDLRFMLVDMKKVEFKSYIDYKLPHAEYVALQADPEYALNMLKLIQKKVDERARLFQENGVSNYAEYRIQHPESKLPRYLIIIDEYQEMFKGSKKGEIERALETILRTARAFGFNMILSSQNVALSPSLLLNFSHRIVMKMKDQMVIQELIGSYSEKRPLNFKPGEALIHVNKSEIMQSFFLPLPNFAKEGQLCRFDYMKRIADAWDARTNGEGEYPMYVFDLQKLAYLESNKTVASMQPVPGIKNILFTPGEKLMADGDDFICKITGRENNENILVVGGDTFVSAKVANGCLHSMLPQFASSSTEINILNFIPKVRDEVYSAVEKSAHDIQTQYPLATYSTSGLQELLDRVKDEIAERTTALQQGQTLDPHIIAIFGTGNCPELANVKSIDEFLGIEEIKRSPVCSLLKDVLAECSIVGIHFIIHIFNTEEFDGVFESKGNSIGVFKHRLLLQMSNNASEYFLENYMNDDAANLVNANLDAQFAQNVCLYYNSVTKSQTKLKPYEF
ncbi:MAG: hypothetical protein MJZ32_10610 [Bacteroidaceae bacterium]|nr:hypothetical protein [Bacteroidaceae bacterium]